MIYELYYLDSSWDKDVMLVCYPSYTFYTYLVKAPA